MATSNHAQMVTAAKMAFKVIVQLDIIVQHKFLSSFHVIWIPIKECDTKNQ